MQAHSPAEDRGRRPAEPSGPTRRTPRVDTTHPYLVRFASGASIAVFFYNGPASRAIAFEGLLDSGDNLVARLKAGFKDAPQPQLVHVATDGESYGHHHKYGEMALAYALRLLEQDKTVKLTNYGSFLEQFPPEFECEIVDDTSWSCEHGVERWRSNCGCNGGKPGWNQAWRAPLRQALDELRDALVPLTEQRRRQALQRCVGRARRLHSSGSRPQHGVRWTASLPRNRRTRSLKPNAFALSN